MATRFNAQVGRRRVQSLTDPFNMTQTTRSVRESMAGIIRNYRNLVGHVEQATPQILLEALEPTFEKSKEYCPTDTGRLKKSGYLEITQFRGTPTVEIGYGLGGEPPYAATVHENMEWKHKAPTRAKWLQVALAEDAQQIQERIVNGYRRVFG